MHTQCTSSVEDIEEAGQFLLSNFIFVAFHSVIKNKNKEQDFGVLLFKENKKKFNSNIE